MFISFAVVIFIVNCTFLCSPRDALYCKARYWDCMSSVRLSVRPWRWWIRTI